MAQDIVHLWSPDGQRKCPVNTLATLIGHTYAENGCSEIISCCQRKGCIIVPNTAATQNLKVGYYNRRAFKGHRFFSSFYEIAEALYDPFRKALSIQFLQPENSLFAKLVTSPGWITRENTGRLKSIEL